MITNKVAKLNALLPSLPSLDPSTNVFTLCGPVIYTIDDPFLPLDVNDPNGHYTMVQPTVQGGYPQVTLYTLDPEKADSRYEDADKKLIEYKKSYHLNLEAYFSRF